MRNITVAVPDEVYQSARLYAARNKTSVSAMVADFLFIIRHLARADQPVSPGAAIDHDREQLTQNSGASILKRSASVNSPPLRAS